MKTMRFYEQKNVETEPLKRTIMVHKSMIYKCECCDKKFKFYLEKGLEDEKQDALNQERHYKPVPFTTACLCGGILVHEF